MSIVVFDIDGTLTDTMAVDVECYEAAIDEILGIEIPSDWPSFDDVTDVTILTTACERLGLPAPDGVTLERIAVRVGELLELALRAAPERFQPIPGATEVFGHVRDAGWSVAMATGAWRPSAVVKLEGAGVPHAGVPLSSASDRPRRPEIIRHAVESLGAEVREAVVYVGDGVWDGRAAGSLGYAFLGVGDAEREGLLHGAGAGAVVEDFKNPDRLVELLGSLLGEAKSRR